MPRIPMTLIEALRQLALKYATCTDHVSISVLELLREVDDLNSVTFNKVISNEDGVSHLIAKRMEARMPRGWSVRYVTRAEIGWSGWCFEKKSAQKVQKEKTADKPVRHAETLAYRTLERLVREAWAKPRSKNYALLRLSDFRKEMGRRNLNEAVIANLTCRLVAKGWRVVFNTTLDAWEIKGCPPGEEKVAFSVALPPAPAHEDKPKKCPCGADLGTILHYGGDPLVDREG